MKQSTPTNLKRLFVRTPFILSILLLYTSVAMGQDTTTTPIKKDGIKIVKGLKFAIITFSVSTRNADNDNSLLVNYVTQNKSSWDFRVDGGYIFAKNLGVGLGLSYGESSETNSIKSSTGELVSNKNHSNEYGFRPFIKNFIPLDAKNRFYIINQTELQFSFERSINESTTNSVLTRTYSTKNTYGIGLRPGILVFVVRNFAFETNVNVFGIQTSIEKDKVTGMPDSKVVKTDVDLKISLLQLAFGLSLYF